MYSGMFVCLSSADVCRHIASYLNCADLLQVELVSKLWQDVTAFQFRQIRHQYENLHFLFKHHVKFHSDKRACSRLYNNRTHQRSQAYILGGAMHANCKTTYRFQDLGSGATSTVDENYGAPPRNICCATDTTDADGNLLLIGGWIDKEQRVTDTVLAFNLADPTMECQTRAPLNRARCFGAASTINGDVVHCGGGDSPFENGKGFADCSIRKAGSENWLDSVIPDMMQPRCGHRAVTLLNDSIFVVGGYMGNQTFLSSTELLDSRLDRWLPMPSMSLPRSGSAAVLGPGGAVYVTGGARDLTHGHKQVERFDPREGTWTSLADMQAGRAFTTACLSVYNGFFVVGGLDNFNAVDSVEFYDFRANKWNYVMGGEYMQFELNRVTAYCVLVQ